MTKRERQVIENRVARGRAFLNKVKPEWPTKVLHAHEAGRLSMSSGTHCVLGVTFRDHFDEGCAVLEETIKNRDARINASVRHGFDTKGSMLNRSEEQAYWSALGEAWVAAAKDERHYRRQQGQVTRLRVKTHQATALAKPSRFAIPKKVVQPQLHVVRV